MSVLFPHSVWIDSQESLAVPVVITPRLVTSVQFRVIWPRARWSWKVHSSRVGVDEYMGVLVEAVVADLGVSIWVGFFINPSM